jgi:antitoxin component YwqK of YwqJK toxin-antitoxin module
MMHNRVLLMMMAGLACALLVSCSDKKTDGKADRWVHYATTPDGSQKHYDKQSIATVSPKVVKVWDRAKLSSDARNKVIEQRKRSQLPTDGWDRLDNVRLLREIDCANRTQKIIRIEDYSENGGIIHEADYPNPKPENVPPGTMIESLLQEVCK